MFLLFICVFVMLAFLKIYSSYEELKESKTTILEGRLLKEALEKREQVSSESLEDEIAELNARKESLLRQKQLKTKQLHILR